MAHPSTRGDGWYLNQSQKIQVEQIWNTQAEQLQQMALRLVRDPEAAEEIVQQVFLSACQKSDQLLACANPSSWLCRTLYCKVLIVFCKRRREKGHITLEAIEQEAVGGIVLRQAVFNHACGDVGRYELASIHVALCLNT